METVVSRTLSVHKEHEFLLKLELAGLTDQLAQQVIGAKDNAAAKRIIHILEDKFEPSSNQKQAREIMGANYFGIEEATACFKIKPTRVHLAGLAEIPFSVNTLLECKDTHLLVAVFSIPVLDISTTCLHEGKNLLRHERGEGYLSILGDGFYSSDKHQCDRGELGWHLVQKVATRSRVPLQGIEKMGNMPKSWVTSFKSNEQPVTFHTLMHSMIGYFTATGNMLFPDLDVVCLDRGGSFRFITSKKVIRDGCAVCGEEQIVSYGDRHAIGFARERRPIELYL